MSCTTIKQLQTTSVLVYRTRTCYTVSQALLCKSFKQKDKKKSG